MGVELLEVGSSNSGINYTPYAPDHNMEHHWNS
jgi:hypothetical protein